MGEIIVEVTIASKKDGKLLNEKFSMDEGMYKAILTLPKDEQIRYFTDEYREHKHEEQARSHELLAIDAEDKTLELIHDYPDEASDPHEYALAQERNELLTKALLSLRRRPRFAVIQVYLEGRKQRDVACELNIDESTLSKMLSSSLAKLRAELDGKI
jgi:RNA polymerase sigma factor (sigma-70 family)